MNEPTSQPDLHGDWLANLNQSLASVYVAGLYRQRHRAGAAEQLVQAYVEGYQRACEDFAVSAEQKEALLRRAGLGDLLP